MNPKINTTVILYMQETSINTQKQLIRNLLRATYIDIFLLVVENWDNDSELKDSC